MNTAQILKRLNAGVTTEALPLEGNKGFLRRAKVVSSDGKHVLAIAEDADEKTAIEIAINKARIDANLPETEPTREEALEADVAALKERISQLEKRGTAQPALESFQQINRDASKPKPKPPQTQN